MGNFVEYLKGISRELDEDIHFPVRDDNANYLRLQKLIAAREAQLKAAETGDGSVTALWVVALALPVLAVFVTRKKKRI